jgi:hypothetical protein
VVAVGAAVTVEPEPVTPALHVYEAPPPAVRVAVVPVQMIPSSLAVPEVSVTVIEGIGSGLTVTMVVAEAVQPSALVTVTV